MANISNLNRLLGSQKNILLSEKRAQEALQKARNARVRYERSVAESLLKSFFDLGLGIENTPFIIGAVLDAKSRNEAAYFEELGREYMTRGAKAETPSSEGAPAEETASSDRTS